MSFDAALVAIIMIRPPICVVSYYNRISWFYSSRVRRRTPDGRRAPARDFVGIHWATFFSHFQLPGLKSPLMVLWS